MPVATLVPPTDRELLRRKKFTRADVETMLDAGIFQGQRFELIDGDLIDKMGQKPLQANAISCLAGLLFRLFGQRIRVQLPIDVIGPDQQWNQPEPDVEVLRSEIPAYRNRHPLGNEMALLVEVADTTIRHDLTVKRDLYARSEVAEYWVLDPVRSELWVHRGPVAGRYESVERLTEEQETVVNGQAQKVSDLFPPA